jgi:hypothetical protein
MGKWANGFKNTVKPLVVIVVVRPFKEEYSP